MGSLFGVTLSSNPAPVIAGTPSPYLQPGDIGYNSNDAYNGNPQPNPAFNPAVAPSTGAPPPTPFVPPPATQTPPQAATGFTPPPNVQPLPVTVPSAVQTPQPPAAGGKGPAPQTLGQMLSAPGGIPATNTMQPVNMNNPNLANLQNALTSKGAGKGPSGNQQPMQTPLAFPGTAPNQLDFHTQLQNFINTGLLGGSQRLQG